MLSIARGLIAVCALVVGAYAFGLSFEQPSRRPSSTSEGLNKAARGHAQDSLEPYVETIPGTLVEFNMVPVPGGTVTVETPDGKKRVEVGPFWIGQTEVTWDVYDVFVYGLDEKQSTTSEADALSRPSDPYVLFSEKFGHQGYPALAMTRHAAEQYARWLSIKTGKTYRLPTPAQWTYACRAGLPEGAKDGKQHLRAYAWHQRNAEGRPHPVASLQPNRFGLYDMRGNVAEYVAGWSTAPEHPPVVRGGSFRSEAAEVSCAARMHQTPAWNASDPQLPKSRWWLPDAPFVGFRLVREPPSTQ